MSDEILKALNDIESGNALDAIEGAKRMAQYDLSDEQIEILIKVPISGKELHNKKAATYALSSILNCDKCVLTLIDLLASPKSHEEVRGHAAEGLGMLHIANKQLLEKAENVLIGGLNDPSPVVRFWSCYAVGQKRMKKAIPILEDLVSCDTDICPSWWYVSEEAEDAIEWICGRDGKDRIPVKDRKVTEPLYGRGSQEKKLPPENRI
jgi:HEAT repeat protein